MKSLADLRAMKQQGEKITMLTAYDYPSAKQVEAAGTDTILVGDSLGMTVLGYQSTVQVTLEDMLHHAKAARRGAPKTYIVVDLPIGAVGISPEHDLRSALRLYQESGCDAVKVEGGHVVDFVEACARIGIPVVGHLGLTPQSVGLMGYRLQGGTAQAAQRLIDDCLELERRGVAMIVLEAVPADLAQEITRRLEVTPTIGIGAGAGTDGQVLVYHDVLAYGTEHRAKFVKVYGDFGVGVAALQQYCDEVRTGVFPDEAHTYAKRIMGEVTA